MRYLGHLWRDGQEKILNLVGSCREKVDKLVIDLVRSRIKGGTLVTLFFYQKMDVKTRNSTCSRNRHVQSFSAKRVLADPLEYPFWAWIIQHSFAVALGARLASVLGANTRLLDAAQVRWNFTMGHGHEIQVDSLTAEASNFKAAQDALDQGACQETWIFNGLLFRFRSFYPVVIQDLWFCFDTWELRSECQAGDGESKE